MGGFEEGSENENIPMGRRDESLIPRISSLLPIVLRFDGRLL